jgi:hypothetical protein
MNDKLPQMVIICSSGGSRKKEFFEFSLAASKRATSLGSSVSTVLESAVDIMVWLREKIKWKKRMSRHFMYLPINMILDKGSKNDVMSKGLLEIKGGTVNKLMT